MPSSFIATTAIIHPGARVHPSSSIGDFCIVEEDVEIGPNNRIDPMVTIKRYTSLGEGNHLFSGCQIGIDPFDKRFDEAEASYTRLGNQNIIRECVTISRGTQPGSSTDLGDGNYIMSNVHVAHNCKLGSNITIAPSSSLGGHAEIEDGAFISSGVGVHQFDKVGRLAMVAANVRVAQDVPPFVLVSDFDCAAHGLNTVGLRRGGYSREAINALKQAYRLLYRSGLARKDALAQMEALGTPEVLHMVAFIRSSHRGICRDHRHAAAVSAGPSGADE